MKKQISILLALVLVIAAAAGGCSADKNGAAEQPQQTDDPVIAYLEGLSQREDSIIRWEELEELHMFVYHYQVQPDGHGLAMMMPDDADASGSDPVMLYETGDGGESWTRLPGEIRVLRGSSEVVYMGEVVVIAADCAKATCGGVMISYDRGHTWSDNTAFSDLISYDEESGNLIPHIINYNAESGLITFAWTQDNSVQVDSETYVLINQFDVNTCRIVEEYYRHPALSA